MLLRNLSITEKINIIVSSFYIVDVPEDLIEKVYAPVIMLKYPSLKHRMMADRLYNIATNRAKQDGLLSREDLEKMLVERGVFKKEDEERIEFLQTQIKAQKVLLSKMKFAKAKIEALKNRIAKLENDLSILVSKREAYLVTTTEAMASQEKLDYLVWATSYTFDDNLIWPKFSDYLNETDLEFKNTVYYLAIEFLYGFDVKQLREIARHPEWRVRYTSFLKGNFPLFSTKPEDYTKDQLSLMHWSNFYQSIYEMLPEDRPDDDIIEDDDRLDKYMEEYFKELEQQRKINRAANNGADAFDREEVIVTRFSELYEDLEYDKVKPAPEGCKVIDVVRDRK